MYNSTITNGRASKIRNMLVQGHLLYSLSSHEFNVQSFYQICVRNIHKAQFFNNKRTSETERKKEPKKVESTEVQDPSKSPQSDPNTSNSMSDIQSKPKSITGGSLKLKKAQKRSAACIIKKYQEDKLVFGDLVETHVERKKNKKLSASQPLPKDKSQNSELFWALKFSNKHMRKLNISKRKESVINTDEKSDSGTEISSGDKASEDEQKDKILKSDSLNSTKEDEASEVHITESLKLERTSNYEKEALPVLCYTALSHETIKDIASFPLTYSQEIIQNLENLERTAVMEQSYTGAPSVTKILQETMSQRSRTALETWKQNMIRELGQEGFDQYKNDLMADGRMLHECIQTRLLSKEVVVPEHLQPTYYCLEHVFKDIDNIVSIESNVVHPKLVYKGIVDCIASYRGERCVIDWKKSNKPKLTLKSMFDGPIQLAAYIGAVNASQSYPFMINKGLLVVAYTNGCPAQVHEINITALQQYWKEWLMKLKQYYTSTWAT